MLNDSENELKINRKFINNLTEFSKKSNGFNEVKMELSIV